MRHDIDDSTGVQAVQQYVHVPLNHWYIVTTHNSEVQIWRPTHPGQPDEVVNQIAFYPNSGMIFAANDQP